MHGMGGATDRYSRDQQTDHATCLTGSPPKGRLQVRVFRGSRGLRGAVRVGLGSSIHRYSRMTCLKKVHPPIAEEEAIGCLSQATAPSWLGLTMVREQCTVAPGNNTVGVFAACWKQTLSEPAMSVGLRERLILPGSLHRS